MRKSLFFDGLIEDLISAKERDPSTPILGTRVFHAAFAQALSEYGSYDEYLCAGSPVCSTRTVSERGDWRDRFVALPTSELLSQLACREHIVLFAGGLATHSLAAVRYTLGRASVPVVGVTHSLHGAQVVLNVAAGSALLGPNDAVVCTSYAARRVLTEALAAVAASRCHAPTATFQLPVIPIGVDTNVLCRDECERQRLRAEYRLAGDSVVLLYLGRISTTFKADLSPAVRLVAALRRLGVNVELFVAGDTSAEPESLHLLRRLAEDLGCGPAVHAVGAVTFSARRSLYSIADVFLGLSDNVQETFGMTLVEAMASELPVVAADWSGYRDIVEHGITGFLVRTYRSGVEEGLCVGEVTGHVPNYALLAMATTVDFEELVAHTALLCRNASVRLRMGAAGRSVAIRRFAWKEVIHRYEALWADLCSERVFAENASGGHALAQCSTGAFTYGRLFGHYASAELRMMDLVNRGDVAGLLDFNVHELSGISAESLEVDLLNAVLDSVSGPIELGELERRVSGKSRSRSSVRLHVAWLIKRGYLHLMRV